MSTQRFDELGFYLLAGAPEGPADLLREARRGEELGLGTGFISERWNVKEAASLTGAACAVTSRIRIATAATRNAASAMRYTDQTRRPLRTGDLRSCKNATRSADDRPTSSQPA